MNVFGIFIRLTFKVFYNQKLFFLAKKVSFEPYCLLNFCQLSYHYESFDSNYTLAIVSIGYFPHNELF